MNNNTLKGKRLKYYDLFFPMKWKHKHLEKYKDSVILDMGCGNGRYSYLSDDWYGIDAFNTCNHKNFKIGDATNIPFNNNSMDVIIMSHVLEHIDRRDMNKVISEINRVLKYHGEIVIYSPQPLNPFYWDVPSHINPITLRSTKMMFYNNGYSIIKEGYSVYRFLPENMQKLMFILAPHIPSEFYLYLRKEL